MSKILKIILIILGVFALLISGFIAYMMTGQKGIKDLKINDIDLTTINDGTYKGEYQNSRWTSEVMITVKDHKITDINFTKIHVFDNPEVREGIINDVKESQSLDVDTVSGATVSIKAYLKAIENALK
jgi:uncharacterized protein with FMN-binding domain